MLIKGTDLTPAQRRQVLDSFIYRWTADNPHRERAWAAIPHRDRPRIPLISDEEWLSLYSFHFDRAGRLSARKSYAEPVLHPPPPPIENGTKASRYTLACLQEQ